MDFHKDMIVEYRVSGGWCVCTLLRYDKKWGVWLIRSPSDPLARSRFERDLRLRSPLIELAKVAE